MRYYIPEDVPEAALHPPDEVQAAEEDGAWYFVFRRCEPDSSGCMNEFVIASPGGVQQLGKEQAAKNRVFAYLAMRCSPNPCLPSRLPSLCAPFQIDTRHARRARSESDRRMLEMA